MKQKWPQLGLAGAEAILCGGTVQLSTAPPFEPKQARCGGSSCSILIIKQNNQSQLPGAVGLVEKVIAVARHLLGVLIDRNGDCLDVLATVALTRGPLAQLGKRIVLWRVVRKALNRHVERGLNPDRKETPLGKAEAQEGQAVI